MGFAARYGGEEFCLLLPNLNSGRAMRVGEMVRAAVSGLAIPRATSPHQEVTVSVACARPNEMKQPRDLIEAADAALYAAKAPRPQRRGRRWLRPDDRPRDVAGELNGFSRPGTKHLR
jgi:diguanylate cyclase (GGDEF)-like protein